MDFIQNLIQRRRKRESFSNEKEVEIESDPKEIFLGEESESESGFKEQPLILTDNAALKETGKGKMVTTQKTKARLTTASHRWPPPDLKCPVNKFFQLVLPSAMKRNMIRIPSKFVKLQGSKLFEFVTLESPMGFKRSIKLKRIGEEIWFEEGWSEFAKAHCISEGQFLLFEYKGNSSFRVIIFDISACEIECPLDVVHISDSDDEIIDLTYKGFIGDQGTRENEQSVNGGDSEHNIKKRPRDTEFENILEEVDAINSIEISKEEEEDERVFKGNQFF